MTMTACYDSFMIMNFDHIPRDWLDAAVTRCRRSLHGAKTAADRLALLRTLALLQGGRTIVDLDEAEVALLARFGLARTPDGAIRIVDEVDARVPADFWPACRFDSTLRRPRDRASPDGILRRHTDYNSYTNSAQKAAVRALLTVPTGGGVMVSIPTGAGKSLLFQLEALRHRRDDPGSCVVVITPTVSLALDHARSLSGIKGLEGSRAITGDLSGEEREAVLMAFRRGEVPILLLSPEYALKSVRNAIVDAAKPQHEKLSGLAARLRAFFIDEAHIVESWGRSFRPDFQRLPALLTDLRVQHPGLPVVLLSATLPPAARQVLRQSYGDAGSWLEVDAKAPRYEFDIVVQSYQSGEERLAALDAVIDHAPRPLVIYTSLAEQPTSVKESAAFLRIDASTLFKRLRERGYDRIALFTGNISDSAARLRIVEQWAADQLDIVVATSAFGMGVDKADVRSVIHACLPESPARWYQEVGRISRDGHQGLAVCLFTHSSSRTEKDDVDTAFSQATGSWLTREKAESRLRALIESRSDVRWIGGHQCMLLDLDAFHGELRGSSDYNRTWNMSLINLLQRSNVLEVLSAVSADGNTDRVQWEVKILDPHILIDSSSFWDRIETVRNAELDVAKQEMRAFLDIMITPRDECLIQRIFRLIEGDTDLNVPECGRCPSCRDRSVPPPDRLRYWGLERIWTEVDGGTCHLPPDTLLVNPEDANFELGLDRLIKRLTVVGIEQFVLPPRLVDLAAEILADSSAHLGLVIGQDEWLESEAELATLPTAVFLAEHDPNAASILWRARQWQETRRDRRLIVVTNTTHPIGGRRADQIVSGLAPYSEEILVELALLGRRRA